MKIPIDPRIPQVDNMQEWRKRLTDLFRDIAFQVNSFSEGKIVGAYNAAPAAPSTGTYSAGDFVKNSAPSELGTGGSKYVIRGWICTVSGTPGTFVQCRYLTGN